MSSQGGNQALLWGSIITLVLIAPVSCNLAAPESGQNPPASVTVIGTFDPYLTDFKSSQMMTNAINQLKAQAKCRPPRITFKIFSHATSDPSFNKDLGDKRKEAMEQYLHNSQTLLGPDEYNVQSAVVPGDDKIELNLEKFNDQDRDPPKLNVNWDPAPGTPVREGDQIKVKITASERYEDGHKSWPTGVQSIQLIANGGVQEPTGDYSPPQPCERRTLDKIYTVPKDPPAIVHLEAYVEDGANNNDSKTADYPTREWSGTLREHAQGNIYNETVIIHFSFMEERDGTIKGNGRVNMESEPQPWCNGGRVTRKLITTDQSELPIGGKRVGEEFQLELPTDYILRLRVKTDCPPPRKSGTTEATRRLGMSESFYHPKVQRHDGAKNSFQSAGAIAVSGSIEIHHR